MLAGTLALALPLSLLLVLLPLATLGRRPDNRSRLRPGIYFLCLGLAFLFVEIACMQRYGLFVGHPLIATVSVLAGFLLFAGAGSLVASRLRDRARALHWAALGIVLLLLFQVTALPPPPGIVESMPARAMLTLALIAPLAFLMGMPFPLGLSRLASRVPGIHSLGLGHQWVRLGAVGVAGRLAGGSRRFQGGAIDGGWTVRGGGAHLVDVPIWYTP